MNNNSGICYTITVTEKQARVLSMACEVLSRLGMGQLKDAFEHLPKREKVDWSAWHDDMQDVAKILSRHMQGGIDGIRSSTGINNADDDARTAWDIHAVIRHRLAWDRAVAEGITDGIERKWPEMMQVSYDDPMKYSDEPLARIRRAENF